MAKTKKNVHMLNAKPADKTPASESDNKKVGATPERKARVKRITGRFLGIVLILIATSFYVQLLPLLFAFIGGAMGVPADAGLGDMDAIIWALVSLGVMLPVLWLYITVLKYIWFRFVWNQKK